MKGKDSGLESGPLGFLPKPDGGYIVLDDWPKILTPLNPETVCYKKCPLYKNREAQCAAYKLFSSFFIEDKSLIEAIEKLRKEHCYKQLGLVVE